MSQPMERVQIDMEFLFRASPTILYQFFTSPACLVRWFCDEVDIESDIYTFNWNGEEEEAELVDDIEEERLRFCWLEAGPGEYLEIRLRTSEVTAETILEITDFCDADEVKDQKLLWTSLMERLRRETGG